jgi:hypothetical protein
VKSFIVAVLIAIGFAIPMAAFAKTYNEVSLGMGTNHLSNGQYTYGILGEEATNPDVLETNSYDFTGSYSHFWSSNDTVWLGLGFSLTIPLSYDQNAANQGRFESPTLLSMDASFRFDVTPEISITTRLSMFGAVVHNTTEGSDYFGVGGSVGLGPTFYFSEKVGISCLVGGTLIDATNMELLGLAFGLISEAYANSGWFATACLVIKF